MSMAETDKTSAKTAPDAESAAADSPAESADSAESAESAESAQTPVTGPPADGAADDPAALSAEALLERLTQAEAGHAQAKDDLLRARAETENVRRRAQNEVVAARQIASARASLRGPGGGAHDPAPATTTIAGRSRRSFSRKPFCTTVMMWSASTSSLAIMLTA